ncbi:adenosylcobinamide-phosphate synthase CbiB [Priestia aryabhattai]|uniref:adenosylcobinamide-phosphate synthase CbiB n=1 Tax=Priestia TaxID=2800373 RepID=UPI00398F00EA
MNITQAIIAHMTAMTIALVIDRIIGDPENWPHPVRWFGKWIYWMDSRLNKGAGKRFKGLLLVISMAVLAGVVPFLFLHALYGVHFMLGVLVEGVMIATTISTRSLSEAAYKVQKPLQLGDMEKARYEVSMIVGRDTDRLSEGEIARATVETVAENTSDGTTAPLFYAFIGGGALAFFYRAINTCDSMVGYKNDRYFLFGYFSAKTDDVLNYIPSRLTAVVMTAVNVAKSQYSLWHVTSLIKRDAKKHPSPNSGYGESAVAALLGIQLGGLNTYKGIESNRAKMGEPLIPLQAVHIEQAVFIMKRTVYATWLLYLLLGGVISVITYTWS